MIRASPRAVWDVVADIEGHGAWQVDVADIRMTSTRRRGAGTSYDVRARIGPIRMVIPMTITEWRDRRSVSTRYDGSLRGQGTITVKRHGRGRTKVTWSAACAPAVVARRSGRCDGDRVTAAGRLAHEPGRAGPASGGRAYVMGLLAR